jgi:hypothetical protein
MFKIMEVFNHYTLHISLPSFHPQTLYKTYFPNTLMHTNPDVHHKYTIKALLPPQARFRKHPKAPIEHPAQNTHIFKAQYMHVCTLQYMMYFRINAVLYKHIPTCTLKCVTYCTLRCTVLFPSKLVGPRIKACFYLPHFTI